MRHDRDRLAFLRQKVELEVANLRQEIDEAELAAILAGCPHWEPCATEADCYRRGLHCRCVEPHETEPECRAWLREHSDGTE